MHHGHITSWPHTIHLSGSIFPLSLVIFPASPSSYHPSSSRLYFKAGDWTQAITGHMGKRPLNHMARFYVIVYLFPICLNKQMFYICVKIIRSYTNSGLNINPTQITVAETTDIWMPKVFYNKQGAHWIWTNMTCWTWHCKIPEGRLRFES